MRPLTTLVILAVSTIALALGACAAPAPGPLEVAGTPIPTPQAGKAVAIGQVLSETTGNPLGDTIIRLAEVYRQGGEGAFVLDGARSPGAITDDQGRFLIPDIEPVEYVVIVGDVFGEYVILAQPSGEARVWTAEENAVLDLGVLEADLAP